MNRFVSWAEVRLGLRLVAKQPVLSLTIILALATGIGVATVGFTFRDALLNSPLPFDGGDRFVRLTAFEQDGGRAALDLDRYHHVLERGSTLAHIGAVNRRQLNIEHPSGEVESILGAYITPRSMRFLPASPLAGRNLIPSDGEPGAEPVALLRDSLLKRRYGGDAGLIGRQLDIAGRKRTVVGVMPDTFEFPAAGEIWLPLDDLTLGGTGKEPGLGVRAFGVLRDVDDLAAVNTELDTLSRQVTAAAGSNVEVRVQARPYTTESDEAGVAFSVLLAVLVMLLLVVASNVATLVFARTWSRAPELAVRTALGAGRSRVVGQLFVEVLILGTIAAVVGLTAARVALDYMSQPIFEMPFWVDFSLKPRTMAFVVFLTFLVSAVSGLLPALRVTRHDLGSTLHAGRGFASGGFGKAGATMLVVEIALSVALLNGAVTMARAFSSYVDEIPALPKRQVLTAQIGYIQSPELRDRVVKAAREIPGVLAAGAASHLPRLDPPAQPIVVAPEGDEPARAPQLAPTEAVADGFLEAIGARATAGRLFAPSDFLPGAAPVVVINEPFVQKFLGGRNPIGRRIRVAAAAAATSEEPWREIVGVVPDLGLSAGDPSLAAGYYAPVRGEMLYYMAMRTTADPLTLIAPLRKAVARVSPDLELDELMALDDVGRGERVFLSSVASALTAMGVMALLLSIVGIYALLSFMVTRRTREIGIRVALGATGRQVLLSVTGAALVYLAVGGAIGSGLGLAFVQMRSLILIRMPEPGVWMPLTIFLTLATAGLTACWLPARRALGIRPAEALSAD